MSLNPGVNVVELTPSYYSACEYRELFASVGSKINRLSETEEVLATKTPKILLSKVKDDKICALGNLVRNVCRRFCKPR